MRLILATCLFAAACEAPPEAAPAQPAPGVSAGSTAQPDARPELSTPRPQTAHPCMVQDGEPVRAAAVRAIGTEPFWAIRTQGRCVTYSTPDDQAGTRIWARAASGGDERSWTGALRGKPFRLSIRPMPGCSDGMSDNVYPFEARVLVDGEERRGCAEERPTGR